MKMGLAAFPLLKGLLGFVLSDASEVAPEEPKRDVPAKKAAPAVLVIDDDKEYLESVRELLQATGFDVLTSTSAAKGLDIMRYYQGDLRIMLLDCNMPRLNGAETLEYARRINPHIKVIGMIDVDMDSLPVSFRAGVQGIVAKPVQGAELIGTINALLKDRLVSPTHGLPILPAPVGAVG